MLKAYSRNSSFQFFNKSWIFFLKNCKNITFKNIAFAFMLLASTGFVNTDAFAQIKKARKEKVVFQTPAQTTIAEDDFETYETEQSEEIYDPLEKYNRKIFVFNDAFDRYFLEYVARLYRDKVPKEVRSSTHNFLNNLYLPISVFNSLAQGKVENGLATFSNFLINTTLGIGGLFDVAGNKGLKYNYEDFGQTLGHYGYSSGAYLMIPFFGPSSTRDLTGTAVNNAINPIGFNLLEVGGKDKLLKTEYLIAINATSGIDQREGLIDIVDDLRKDSFDFYATIRSAYLQKRQAEIKN